MVLEGENYKAEHLDGSQVAWIVTPSMIPCAIGHLALSGPQFPYWTRSGFEAGGLLKSFEELFDTAFGILCFQLEVLLPGYPSPLVLHPNHGPITIWACEP